MRISLNILAVTALCISNASASSATQMIKQWIENEFTHSTLSQIEQLKELSWFESAAKPYRGMSIRVVSEDIATHRYESEILAKAFYEITGIHVVHEITKEDDVVKKMQVQMATDINIYDAYVNDVDFIGTHFRHNKTVPISEMLNGQWREITLPSLDLADFIGLDFAKGLDGVLYQLPTQQFANLYWYRHDWFSREELQEQFEALYGYSLGVPQNWQAYEDIAHFFTNQVKTIDGQRVWGHMDYGRNDPSLGWRISDSWLSLAGVNDISPSGYSNGNNTSFVGDWGIRLDNCHPAGASTKRGGALDSPAAIYAVQKYISWLHDYAPDDAIGQSFSTSTDYLARGNIAQQVFWYTAFIPTVTTDNLLDENGNPVWRVAPSPRGKYWKPGMKSGYQDIGGWTFLKSTPDKQLEAAWLYAQFTVAKSVSLQKFLNGFTPIRQSDITSEYALKNAKKWGGLLEFYNSNARKHWTPTGISVPDYAALSSTWWQHVGPAIKGELSVESSMKKLAEEMDRRLMAISAYKQLNCSPKLNSARNPSYWLNKQSSPWAEIYPSEQPVTLPYDEALQLWQKY